VTNIRCFWARRAWLAGMGLLGIALAGCDKGGEPAVAQPPWVLSVALEPVPGSSVTVSGTVRAHSETPLAFEVGGRIKERHVDAGERVKAGQLLYRLEPQDFEQTVHAAEAELAAAQAARNLRHADLARAETLFRQNVISRQALERERLADAQSRAQEQAVAARLQQAQNALRYTHLRAGRDGVLIEVRGEPGQVVAAGEPVGVLASGTVREIEVFLPERLRPPQHGILQLDRDRTLPVTLREASGATESASRTWRARYRLPEDAPVLPLGAVVRARFEVVPPEGEPQGDTVATAVYRLPLSAIDERGEGPRLWQVTDGTVQPIPVEVIGLDGDSARVRVSLPAGARVVALGAHLLRPGMAVRERR
jgi:RND family efflux transporter MFP subunit